VIKGFLIVVATALMVGGSTIGVGAATAGEDPGTPDDPTSSCAGSQCW
jgi:hypothetical protein